MSRIGVLALQGAFSRHAHVLQLIGHTPFYVRGARDFEGLEGLVLPGGESTTQLRLLRELALEESLLNLVASGRPVLATCAGLILAAKGVSCPDQRSFGFLDVSVARNAWGRQTDSFEALSDGGRALVFIRAPRIRRIGPDVEVLDRYRGEAVLVRHGHVVCATFHPELTPDPWVHRFAFGEHGAAARGAPDVDCR